ncbi:unnamed protein product [Eruca vesicaria subsp. sativa]|uniref:Uncharacterized protein n=1 Tax=Eruca vesicaria subsp. sativa TaxID=29727 RepID=A0ABC8JG82_ERUVS|nr:unnamed protein product [Eruca vesicaria subsp. sativa]
MNEARAVYRHNQDGAVRKQHNSWKITSRPNHKKSRYVPYEKTGPTQRWRARNSSAADHEPKSRDESSAQGLTSGVNDGSSAAQEEVDTRNDNHWSSGKRLSSQIVSPGQFLHDDHVTKRITPRLLTYSPTEKLVPVDAQIIGALHDSEAMETGEEGGEVAVEDDEGGDLLGEELLEMEASHIQSAREDRGREDMTTREKPKQSSSHRGGGRTRIPMG